MPDYIYTQSVDVRLEDELYNRWEKAIGIVQEQPGNDDLPVLRRTISNARPGDRIIVASLSRISTDLDMFFRWTAERRIPIIIASHSVDGKELSIVSNYLTAEQPIRGKLADSDWAEIERLKSEGVPTSELANIYGISGASISRYLAGKQHVRQKK